MARRVAEDAGGLGTLQFERDGAEYFPLLAADAIADLEHLFCENGAVAGKRLTDITATEPHIGIESPVARKVSELLGAAARPVRAIAFDKTQGANWALGWHQDRTICVKRRVDAPDFGPWTTKQGIAHVQPPFSVTKAMVTVRIHLDDVDRGNAPLKIAFGSHVLGRVRDADAAVVAENHTSVECFAQSGDVWAYATPILHASDRASAGIRRRVLQVDYSAAALPEPLEWLLEV